MARKLRAIASAQGTVHYNRTQQVIEISKRSFSEFTVLDNSLSNRNSPLNSIKNRYRQPTAYEFLPPPFFEKIWGFKKQDSTSFIPGLNLKTFVIRAMD